MTTEIIYYIILLVTVMVIISLLVTARKNHTMMHDVERMIYESEAAVTEAENLNTANLDEPPYVLIRKLQQQDDVLDDLYNMLKKSDAYENVFSRFGLTAEGVAELRKSNRKRILELKQIELKTT